MITQGLDNSFDLYFAEKGFPACTVISGGQGVCSSEGERVPLQERLSGQTGHQTEQAGLVWSGHWKAISGIGWMGYYITEWDYSKSTASGANNEPDWKENLWENSRKIVVIRIGWSGGGSGRR